MHHRRGHAAWVLPVCCWLLGGCGEDAAPHPGFRGPCETAVGPVFGCPASGAVGTSAFGPGVEATIIDACNRLVSCGQLSAERLVAGASECQSDSDCGTGECLPNKDNAPRCHFHSLDLLWCVERLSKGRADPCDGERDFDQIEVAATLSCIVETSCESLGLPFPEKLLGRDNRADVDKYTCNDGKTVFTATVCDHGLLSY